VVDRYEASLAERAAQRRRERSEEATRDLALFAPLAREGRLMRYDIRDIVEQPEAPHNGTETSREAAESLDGQCNRLELMVLRGIIGLGDATRDELEEMLGLTGNCVRPRCWSLIGKGYIRKVDGATRPTRSGRKAEVLTATPKGFDAAARANDGYANVTGNAA
jgi:hypothetical protein